MNEGFQKSLFISISIPSDTEIYFNNLYLLFPFLAIHRISEVNTAGYILPLFKVRDFFLLIIKPKNHANTKPGFYRVI